MLRGWTRYGLRMTGRARTAAVCAAGLATLGCAGSKIDLTTLTRPSAERQDDADDRPASVSKTGFERLLRLRKDADDSAPATEESGGGRVFSAFVDRLPGGRDEVRDPFLAPPEGQQGVPVNEAALAAANRPAEQKPESAARRQPRRTATEPRADDELWRMFVSDAGTTQEHRAEDARPAQVVRIADNSIPEWAKDDVGSSRGVAEESLAAASFQESDDEPAGRARVTSAVEMTDDSRESETPVSFARRRLDSLMAQVRLQEKRGDLIAAYRTAAAASELARIEQIVFAPRDEQPEDVMRRLTEQMRAAHRGDPFVADASLADPVSPFGPEYAREPANAAVPALPAPEVARELPAPAERPARPETRSVASAESDSSQTVNADFPPLHQWRGVAANRPVSLAVVDPTRDSESTGLQHRAARAGLIESQMGPNLDGPLLAPNDDDVRGQDPGRRQAMLAPVRSRGPVSSVAGDSLRPTASRLGVQALPPAETTVDLSVSPASVPMATAENATVTEDGSVVWWVLGALCTIAGALFFRRRAA